jgi:hypothetical protein
MPATNRCAQSGDKCGRGARHLHPQDYRALIVDQAITIGRNAPNTPMSPIVTLVTRAPRAWRTWRAASGCRIAGRARLVRRKDDAARRLLAEPWRLNRMPGVRSGTRLRKTLPGPYDRCERATDQERAPPTGNTSALAAHDVCHLAQPAASSTSQSVRSSL